MLLHGKGHLRGQRLRPGLDVDASELLAQLLRGAGRQQLERHLHSVPARVHVVQGGEAILGEHLAEALTPRLALARRILRVRLGIGEEEGPEARGTLGGWQPRGPQLRAQEAQLLGEVMGERLLPDGLGKLRQQVLQRLRVARTPPRLPACARAPGRTRPPGAESRRGAARAAGAAPPSWARPGCRSGYRLGSLRSSRAGAARPVARSRNGHRSRAFLRPGAQPGPLSRGTGALLARGTLEAAGGPVLAGPAGAGLPTVLQAILGEIPDAGRLRVARTARARGLRLRGRAADARPLLGYSTSARGTGLRRKTGRCASSPREPHRRQRRAGPHARGCLPRGNGLGRRPRENGPGPDPRRARNRP